MTTDRQRLREIITVLGSYGFGELYNRNFKQHSEEESARNLRLAFEELGPSFIKIGQILSTRNDLLSEPYIEELQKLQTASPAFSFEEADEVFKEEFGENLHEAFADVDETPFATGSIAQVHRARTKEGKEVIVKIQRPHIRRDLIRDIDLFIKIVDRIPSIFEDILVDPKAVLEDIRKQSLEEMDFLHEANNMNRFRSNNKDRPLIQAPRPLFPYVSGRVLTQDYIEGLDLTNKDKIEEEGYDLKEISHQIVVSYLYQVFVDGFYHADPHQGNILISHKKIVFIDFGMCGELNSTLKDLLVKILQAIVNRDIDSLTNILLLICQPKGDVDKTALYNDVSDLFDRYLVGGFHSINLNNMFQDLLRLGRRHGLIFPDDMVLLVKTVILVQGVAEDLDPEMDFMSIFNDFLLSGNVIDRHQAFDKGHLLRELSRLGSSVVNIPEKTDKLLDNLNKNRLTVNVQFNHSDKRIRELNQMINRLVISLLLSAIIISSGIIISQSGNEHFTDIGVIFFIAGTVMAFYLLYSFIRSRRSK